MSAGIQAVSCKSCGGAVAMAAGAPHPRCLFCGSEALVAGPPAEDVELPERFLPFEQDEEAARTAFRAAARASIWYPGDLRDARVELARLLLPAWVWAGEVETHWAALVPASTRSHRRPQTGRDRLRLKDVLVPSSSALSRAELQAIAPFHGKNAFVFHADQAVAPFELGRLTRSAARQQACEALAEAHRALLAEQVGATALNGSHLYGELDGRPVLLPIYIGAYRRGSRVHRVVINGQTGRLTGDFPLSWLRIGCAVLGCGGLLALLGLFVLVVGWLASLNL